ncbi:MAG: two-component system regulatory protein YycI [Eubacteriales bacterium]|nr:two-component system regulatory protein YycI [Eubacteriales bacterium]MDD3200320.1 two-component system regulatory protein YycI [Eubacteriales bacterium]MDD4122011.1 two-component system regulatory protein YycI [Eubacteriales bacterium]MDD4629953.1 two-component system regulatory protein YycI [Eubacteriales bacterium]
MDWTKAKSILIVALIVTNLVLIATYFYQEYQSKSNEEELRAATIKLLESKNIFVETEIPEEHSRMPKLTVQYDKMNQDIIEEQLANQKALTPEDMTDDNIMELTAAFIENCGLMTENVTFDRIEHTGEDIRITYKNYLNGYAIEESYIIFTVTDGKISEMKRFWLNPIEVSEIKKEVISAIAALIGFMSENTEYERIHVQDISLVYWLDSGSFDAESPVTDTAFPAWKITYNRGKIQYISAWEQ